MVHYSASAFWRRFTPGCNSCGEHREGYGKWWSLLADHRMIETCTRCLFRWLKVRLISRHSKCSLCLFSFPGMPKHVPWSWKFTAQTSKGGESVPWRLKFPCHRDTVACVFSWAGEGGLCLVWSKPAEEPSCAAEVCETQSDPLMYWGFMVPAGFVPANCQCGMALQQFWSENTLN